MVKHVEMDVFDDDRWNCCCICRYVVDEKDQKKSGGGWAPIHISVFPSVVSALNHSVMEGNASPLSAIVLVISSRSLQQRTSEMGKQPRNHQKPAINL